MEVWKDIKNYENMYQVSNFGNIRRKYKNNQYKMLKPHLNKCGYFYVCLCKNNEKKSIRIHKLVVSTFINNIPDKMEINHKNGIKIDNRLVNLEIVSRSYNQIHAYQNNLEKRQFNNKKKSKPVNQYDINNNFIKTWDSMCEIQRQLKYFKQNISKCCSKKIDTAYGYRWTYAERECLT